LSLSLSNSQLFDRYKFACRSVVLFHFVDVFSGLSALLYNDRYYIFSVPTANNWVNHQASARAKYNGNLTTIDSFALQVRSLCPSLVISPNLQHLSSFRSPVSNQDVIWIYLALDWFVFLFSFWLSFSLTAAFLW
jgi:hypothetical protein